MTSGGRDVGGDTILIQVSAFNGSPGIEVTGMHGATLKDSIKAVYTLIRSNFREFGVPEQRLKTQTVAVHLVKIAEPKDGPSAGLAFLVGMVSALANKPVKPGFAFTGEVAIHGEVGAVGGIPPKLNAGREGCWQVIPLANAGDAGRREGKNHRSHHRFGQGSNQAGVRRIACFGLSHFLRRL